MDVIVRKWAEAPQNKKKKLHILLLSEGFKSGKLLGCEGLFINWYIAFMVILGNDIPVQAWTGPKGSRRYRFPDFKTIGT
jgi:hypothetical protein